ncbi:MAG: hypothetical protein RLW62_24590, partial [Gammaproteobacteria bacterium]
AFLGELVGTLTNPSQRLNEYSMMMHSDQPARMYSHVPYSVLEGGRFTRSVGPLRAGSSCLAPKQDRYTTSQGVLTLAEYNRRAREFRPLAATDDYRHLCETWLKYHADDPRAQTLYEHEQQHSRRLAGRGARLTRAAIEALRGDGA